MTAELFTQIFLVALGSHVLLQLWLNTRHRRHILEHRNAVPGEFARHIELAAHQKAADYSLAKLRLSNCAMGLDTLLLLVLTLAGGLDWLNGLSQQWAQELTGSSASQGGYMHGLLLIAGLALINLLAGLPISLYHTFVLEQRFGFNSQSLGLYFIDLAKQLALAITLGTPLLLLVLWLMQQMGSQWWLYVWLVWLGFNVLALMLYPTLIAPLFNRFTALSDDNLKQRIEALLERCGFHSSGLFVMDGSRRSSHGNAYFTGFGRAKRIVFYDTLISRLAPQEIEAVLAHELGHYRHRHVNQRFILLGLLTLACFALLGQLMDAPWFYMGLGVTSVSATAALDTATTAMALVLFFLVLPSFTFLFSPLLAMLSRRHEYQADAYAARQTAAQDLITALVKLYRDNAATLTPDPLYSLFHDSHPPASLRIAHLKALAA